MGNGYLTSYSANGSVGDFVTADASIEGLNMMFETATSDLAHDPTIDEENGLLQYGKAQGNGRIRIPEAYDGFSETGANNVLGNAAAIDNAGVLDAASQPKALRHGDCHININSEVGLGYDFNSAQVHAQSFTYSFDLSRSNLEQLGSRFAYAKVIDFPLSASCDFSFIVGDMTSATATDSKFESVENYLNQGHDIERNLFVNCFGPITGAYAATNAVNLDGISFGLLGAKIDSQGFSSSIGDNKTMDITMSTQIGGAEDTSHGVALAHIKDTV